MNGRALSPEYFRDHGIRGMLELGYPLGKKSWFRCGGLAGLLFMPSDSDDLQNFLNCYTADEPLIVLGGVANCIVREGGVPGCVIRLGKGFSSLTHSKAEITAGAGALNGTVASYAAKNGIGGFEFLSGVPGTIGGAIAMNAGAYGTETKDILFKIHGFTAKGEYQEVPAKSLNMGYRNGNLPPGFIVTEAVFAGKLADTKAVKAQLKKIKEQRQDSQPIREKTGGSTFANPSDKSLLKAGLAPGTRAWQLIDEVGGRGYRIGGAQISEKHCNFMINTGNATAEELEDLGEEMRRRVKDKFGVTLEWEIKRLGRKLTL